MKILTTDKDFADAIKHNQKINKKIIYYTGKWEEKDKSEYTIGSFYESKGIYAGIVDDKHIFVDLHNFSENRLGWEDAIFFVKEANMSIPDIRQLDLIWLNKDKINKGLKDNGGDILGDNWYWSSTKYCSGYAWILNFKDGERCSCDNGNNKYVRAILVL